MQKYKTILRVRAKNNKLEELILNLRRPNVTDLGLYLSLAEYLEIDEKGRILSNVINKTEEELASGFNLNIEYFRILISNLMTEGLVWFDYNNKLCLNTYFISEPEGEKI